jgi:general secretion pathway protein D
MQSKRNIRGTLGLGVWAAAALIAGASPARAQEEAPAAPAVEAPDPAAPVPAPAPPATPVVRPLVPTVRRPAAAGPTTVRPAPVRAAPAPAVPVPVPAAAAPAPAPAAPAAAPAPAPAAPAAVPAGLETGIGEDARAPALKFENATSDIVLQAYAQETGRTLLFAPDAPKANITLRSQTPLTRREYLEAIQTVLTMYNIALLPVGDKFLKVVPVGDVRRRAIETAFDEPANGVVLVTGGLVSQMVQLKYITLDEVKGSIDTFKRAEGQVQLFERTNSILITDTSENVNRMLEIIRFLDQPRLVREDVYPIQVKYAKAATIKQRLDEIVAESQKAQQAAKESPLAKPSGAPGITRAVSPLPVPVPGIIRPTLPSIPASVHNPVIESLVAEAERGVVRGKVQILADERTNKLIIMTQPENMVFFQRIIDVLDVETAPDVEVRVMRLEYADASDVSDKLNQLIGNVKAEAPKTPGAGAAAGEPRTPGAGEVRPPAENLAAAVARMAQPAGASEAGKSKVGELSKDNIKILPDKRTNALIIMASKSDMVALIEIIRSMDIMLSQVLIETVVLQVSLNKDLQTGIDWVQRARLSNNMLGGRMNPLYYMGGGGGGAGTPVNVQDVFNEAVTGAVGLATSGIQYFFTMPGISVDAVVKASSTDGRTKVLSSPVLLTMDNVEATIESTELVYLNKGQQQTGTTSSGVPLYQNNVDQRDVGITVKIKPRINERKMVVLTVAETIQEPSGTQKVPQTDSEGRTTMQDWPIISTRKLNADIAVKSGETIILGGLVKTSKAKTASKIPLLGDIPLIGKYLFGSTSDVESRSELLVFLTPYVLDTAESIAAEARRRKDYLDVEGLWTKGWSDSKLADETISQKVKRTTAENEAARAAERAARTNRTLRFVRPAPPPPATNTPAAQP